MTERDAVIPSLPNSLSLQYFPCFGLRRSSTCRACSAAAPCTCSITRPPHLLVLCRRILMQITRAICTMSHHFSRLCLCKEGYSCTTSYLIKTFPNLTVSCASDLCFFFLWTREWQPDFHLISWFSFCFEWVCHDQELLNLSIAIAHTEVFWPMLLNHIVK